MGAEKPNENGAFDGKVRRCRLKAESGWGGGRMPQAKEYAPQKRNMQKRRRPANIGGMCKCEVKRQPGTGVCGGKRKSRTLCPAFHVIKRSLFSVFKIKAAFL